MEPILKGHPVIWFLMVHVRLTLAICSSILGDHEEWSYVAWFRVHSHRAISIAYIVMNGYSFLNELAYRQEAVWANFFLTVTVNEPRCTFYPLCLFMPLLLPNHPNGSTVYSHCRLVYIFSIVKYLETSCQLQLVFLKVNLSELSDPLYFTP